MYRLQVAADCEFIEWLALTVSAKNGNTGIADHASTTRHLVSLARQQAHPHAVRRYANIKDPQNLQSATVRFSFLTPAPRPRRYPRRRIAKSSGQRSPIVQLLRRRIPNREKDGNRVTGRLALNIEVAVHTPARALERVSFHSCLSSSAATSLAVGLIVPYNIAEDKILGGLLFLSLRYLQQILGRVERPSTSHS